MKKRIKKVIKKELPPRKKIGKKVYTKTSCSKTKTAATAKAKAARKAGRNARVLKNPLGGYCLFTAGSKRKAPKKATIKGAAIAKPKRRATKKK